MTFWEIIRWPFGQFLRLSYELTNSYVIALLLFAIAVKLLLLPLGIKQQKNQIRAAKLRPKILAIEKKYAGRTDQKTLQKKQQEIMTLQQNEGYSPLSGCLPLLIQLPIIIILYQVIQKPLTYICSFTKDELSSLANLVGINAEDQYGIFQHVKMNSPNLSGLSINAEHLSALESADLKFLNFLDLTAKPSMLFDNGSLWYFIFIPILVFAASFFSMKISRKFMANPAAEAATADMQKSNMIMDIIMPAMSLYFAFIMPAGLGVYWIYQSLLGVAQQYALSRLMPLPTYTAEEIRAMQKAEKERQAAAIAAAKQRRAQLMADDEGEDDIDIPVIRSKFDNDDDEGESKPQTTPKKKK